MLVIDLIAVTFFVIAAAFNQHWKISDPWFDQERILVIISTIVFSLAIIFYCLTLIDPGYVPKSDDFLGLLERLVDENYHLDYVCI